MEIRKAFFDLEGDDVLVFGDRENSEEKRDAANSQHTYNKQKATSPHLLAIVEYVDVSHRDGKGVTVRKVRNHLLNVHGLSISQTQVRYSMKKLGLKYFLVKKRRRNLNSFRPERIREFLIGYDQLYRHIHDGNEERWVFV